MEEKSKKTGKTSKKEENNAPEKPTYEQLEQIAQNLNNQCHYMQKKLAEAEKIVNNVNDIGILLSIIKSSEYFEESFITRCAGKIQSVITEMLDNSEAPESSN